MMLNLDFKVFSILYNLADEKKIWARAHLQSEEKIAQVCVLMLQPQRTIIEQRMHGLIIISIKEKA